MSNLRAEIGEAEIRHGLNNSVLNVDDLMDVLDDHYDPSSTAKLKRLCSNILTITKKLERGLSDELKAETPVQNLLSMLKSTFNDSDSFRDRISCYQKRTGVELDLFTYTLKKYNQSQYFEAGKMFVTDLVTLKTIDAKNCDSDDTLVSKVTSSSMIDF